ncbi:MAG: phosphate uptake regulator [Patescibacteria group bacterium]|jgi:phosphate uptake regulator
MEERKLVKSGNSSFTLALPIKWIRRNNLENDKSVIVTEEQNGGLNIKPSKKTELKHEKKIETININEKDKEDVFLDILSKYNRGFTKLILEGNQISSRKAELQNIIEQFIGLDIIEQERNTLIIKNFLTIDKEFSPRSLIRKISLGINAIFEVMKKLETGQVTDSDLREITEITEQNYKLVILTKRIITILFSNPGITVDFDKSEISLATERVLTNDLYEMSFLLNKIGDALIIFDRKSKDSKIIYQIIKILMDNFLILVSSLRYREYKQISTLAKNTKVAEQKIRNMLKQTHSPISVEIINYSVVINQLIRQIALELL